MKKKKIFIILTIFLQTAFLFAQKINLFSIDKQKLSFENGFLLDSGTDAGINSLGVDFSIKLDQKEFIASSGLRLFPESMSVTHEAIYWPTFFTHFNLGSGIILHYCNYYSYYSEVDFLTGLFFRYDDLKFFNLTFSLLYLRKSSKITGANDYLPWIYNNDLGMKIAMEFHPVNKFYINFNISSYSYYRYMLFFAPDAELQLNFKISENFTTGLDFEIQYVDLFTLSANFNCASIRTFVKMEI